MNCVHSPKEVWAPIIPPCSSVITKYVDRLSKSCSFAVPRCFKCVGSLSPWPRPANSFAYERRLPKKFPLLGIVLTGADLVWWEWMLHGYSIAIESVENTLDFCNLYAWRKFRLQRIYNSLVSRIYECRNVVVTHQELFVRAYKATALYCSDFVLPEWVENFANFF